MRQSERLQISEPKRQLLLICNLTKATPLDFVKTLIQYKRNLHPQNP